jgi:hypothetical protein
VRVALLAGDLSTERGSPGSRLEFPFTRTAEDVDEALRQEALVDAIIYEIGEVRRYVGIFAVPELPERQQALKTRQQYRDLRGKLLNMFFRADVAPDVQAVTRNVLADRRFEHEVDEFVKKAELVNPSDVRWPSTFEFVSRYKWSSPYWSHRREDRAVTKALVDDVYAIHMRTLCFDLETRNLDSGTTLGRGL